MYQSPISLIQKDVESKIDDAVIMAVQKVGVEVDREELLYALRYDRKQYEKGYGDGLSDAVKHGRWIKMSDADGIYWSCSECGEDIPRVAHYNPQFDLFPRLESIDKTNYCPNCGVLMDKGD